MINFNVKNIVAGSTIFKKVMVGPTILWEKVTEVVGELIDRFIARVNNDGGTYVGETTDSDIVEEEGLTLLMKPTAYKTGKIYSAIPEDGSGDFVYGDPTKEPVVVNETIQGEKIGGNSTNLVEYSEDFTKYEINNGTPTILSDAVLAPDGTMTADTINLGTGYIGWNTGRTYTGGNVTVTSIYVKDTTTAIFSNHAYRNRNSFTTEDVGNGWYRHVYVDTTAQTNVYDEVMLLYPEYVGGSVTVWGLQIEYDTLSDYTKTGYESINNSYVDVKPGFSNPLSNPQVSSTGSWSTSGTGIYTRTAGASPVASGSLEVYENGGTSFTGVKYVKSNAFSLESGTYTISAYVRQSKSGNYAAMTLSTSTSTSSGSYSTGGVFNLGTGAAYALGSATNATCELISGSWYRVSVTMPSGGTPSLRLGITHRTSEVFSNYNPSSAAPYFYYSGAMVSPGEELPEWTAGSLPGDVITANVPTGTLQISEFIGGVENVSFDIPTTYQLPESEISMVKMFNYPNDAVAYYPIRIANDGGTYIDGEINDDGQKLLLTPNGYNTGKLYSVIPWDGSGDFVYSDATAVPEISNGAIVVEGESGENLYAYNHTMSGFSYSGNVMVSSTVAAPPNTGINYVWKHGNSDFSYMYWNNSDLPGNYIGFYQTSAWGTNNIRVEDGNYSQVPTTVTSTSVGDGWYYHTFQAPSNTNRIRFSINTSSLAGVQISSTLEGLNIVAETTGTPIQWSDAQIVTTTVPDGVDRIYETVDGVTTKITTIPTTYELPQGNVNKVEMFGGPLKARWSFPGEDEMVDVANPITLKIDLL